MRLKLSLPLLCRLLHHECKYSGKDSTEQNNHKVCARYKAMGLLQETGCRAERMGRKKQKKIQVEKKIKKRGGKEKTKTTEKLTFSSLQQDKSPTWVCLHKIGGGLDGRGTEKKCSPPARVAPWRVDESIMCQQPTYASGTLAEVMNVNAPGNTKHTMEWTRRSVQQAPPPCSPRLLPLSCDQAQTYTNWIWMREINARDSSWATFWSGAEVAVFKCVTTHARHTDVSLKFLWLKHSDVALQW